ncbi:uncharacterized protein [Procambarus clarkii]|uniref:uncharacterized protein n=1 Tax=Procambarus clarkii TaxID=6728 RepID=UPI003742BBDB
MFFTDGASTLSTVTKVTKDTTAELKAKVNKLIETVNGKKFGLHLPKVIGEYKPGYAYGNVKTHKPGKPTSANHQPDTTPMNIIQSNKHDRFWTSWSVSVWEVAADGQDANMTLTQLPHVVDQARRLRQVSWCVTVVVVSDDLAILAAFAQWSLKGRLVGPATRLLAVTNASLVNNPDLSRTYSMMNAVLLAVQYSRNSLWCGVYLHLPYSPQGAQALKVASWTPHQGLALTSSLPLFPNKFSRLSSGPNLVVISETYPSHEAVMVDDPKAPGRKRLEFLSPFAKVIQVLADTTNFMYTFVRPLDGQWGIPLSNGSWSGMIGMVSRKEVDIGLGPIGISASRAQVLDFTWPVTTEYGRIMGGRGRPEVDPWGFVFPLTPLVWVAILTTLLVLPLTVYLLSSCIFLKDHRELLEYVYNITRIFLQQGW